RDSDRRRGLRAVEPGHRARPGLRRHTDRIHPRRQLQHLRARGADRGMRRHPWIAVLACVWAAPLGAQLASGELRIVVTDATGLPVRASGTLVSDASQTHRSFDTGAAGTFTFDRLPDGRYHLTVSSAGLRT